MTSRDGIIRDGTDGPGEASAGRRSSFGRAKSDPTDAETVFGSTGDSPSASQEVGGDTDPPRPGTPAASDPPRADDGSPADAVTSSESDEEQAASLESELDELAKAQTERDEFKDLALRAKADFENYRRRADRERAETRTKSIAAVVRELLPVVDNLDRAVEAAGLGENSEATGDPLADGIRLVHQDLHSMLERLGLAPIDPKGEPFDPNVHEAIASAPAEGAAPNTVVDVAQKGFRLGDIVVRPARVVVST